ncbi:ABC transporter substrate-binding protein [Microbacterium terrisoli]|uniref:ABC transporter substrate-binding protein n=1 Tax=Microbacterium terrisoli TaxID=3242192 RepID=UPI0028041E4E|nr:ABC transporter substrate-binding protein [Microbacterium protaetiae]
MMLETPRLRSSWQKRVGRTLTVLAAAGALALSGCASTGGDTSGAGGDAQLKKVTITTFLPLESLTFTPEMVAQAGGYFEKHGLDVTIQPVQGAPAAVQSVLGGAALTTRVSSIDIQPAMDQGQKVQGIGTMSYGTSLRLVSVDKHPLRTPADLKNATIGMGSTGGTSERTLDLTLDSAGIPRDSVKREVVPVSAATIELVRQGKLDGYIVSMDTAAALKSQNKDVIVGGADLLSAPDMQVWIAMTDSVNDPTKADELKRLLASIRDAVEFVKGDAANGYKNVIATMKKKWTFPSIEGDSPIAPSVLDEYVASGWFDADGNPLKNADSTWQDAYELYTSSGLVSGKNKPMDWLTDKLLPAN